MDIVVPYDQVLVQSPHIDGAGIHQDPHRFLSETFRLVDFVPFHDAGGIGLVGLDIMGSQADGAVGKILEYIVGDQETVGLAIDGWSGGQHHAVIPEEVGGNLDIPALVIGMDASQVTLLEAVVPDAEMIGRPGQDHMTLDSLEMAAGDNERIGQHGIELQQRIALPVPQETESFHPERAERGTVHRQEVGRFAPVDGLIVRSLQHPGQDGRMLVRTLVVQNVSGIAPPVSQFLVQVRLILSVGIEIKPAVLDSLDFVHRPDIPLGENDVGIAGILLRQIRFATTETVQLLERIDRNRVRKSLLDGIPQGHRFHPG